jgi:RNA polymerase sigma-70 factor (ECF subfamily)
MAEQHRPPVEADDDSLMRQLSGGDASAFRALVERHQDAVVAFAYRYLGSRGEAEEMAQEAFLRLYRSAPRYQPRAQFRTYLFTIAARLCINNRVSAARRGEVASGYTERRATSTPREHPEQLAIAAERDIAIRQAVLALPEDQRMALVLFGFEGLSYRAVATVMRKSESSVTSLLWRAREQLRCALAGWLEQEEPRKVLTHPRFNDSDG